METRYVLCGRLISSSTSGGEYYVLAYQKNPWWKLWRAREEKVLYTFSGVCTSPCKAWNEALGDER